MPRGPSGRIVLEVDPAVKRDLYSILEKEEKTLKNWFLERAEAYVKSNFQPSLFDPPRHYTSTAKVQKGEDS